MFSPCVARIGRGRLSSGGLCTAHAARVWPQTARWLARSVLATPTMRGSVPRRRPRHPAPSPTFAQPLHRSLARKIRAASPSTVWATARLRNVSLDHALG
jgi:hypothetical protein